MYLIDNLPVYAEPLVDRLLNIPAQLLKGLQPCAQPLQLSASEDLGSSMAESQLFYLEEGQIDTIVDGRPLFNLQPGSLIGLRHGLSLPAWTYTSYGNVRLVPYERRDFFGHVYGSEDLQELFTFYLLGQTTLLIEAMTRNEHFSGGSSATFAHFAPGEALINQGEFADNVLVIIEGHAEAWVDNQKVGEVHKDEIFGAMAVFINEPRSATVIATEPCSVMVVPKEQFLSLMQSNSKIALSLIESMARRIDMMNKETERLRKQLQGAQAL